MKIRCKNCYKVLEPNEEYCTYCGEHSEQIKRAMETGNYGPNPSDTLKLSLILFGILAFIGTGIFMVIFATTRNDASMSLFNRSYALLLTSIITFSVIVITCHKSLKNLFWNGNKDQLLGSFILGTVFIVIAFFSSLLTDVTRVLPRFATDYFSNPDASLFDKNATGIIPMIIAFTLVVFTEEIIRRFLIDTFDDLTLLSDFFIVLFSGIIGTIIDFAWIMAPETLIVSFITNTLFSSMYIYTNRSIGVNILVRVLLILCEVLIFM